MKTIICAMCGQKVEVSSHATRAIYCPECWKAARKEKKRIFNERQKDDRPYIMDTPENIETCLSCNLPECRMDSKRCKLYKRQKE